MGVPTITSVSPAVGRTGGRVLIEITGTNFQQLPAPAATGPVATPNPSVRVTFVGVARSRVSEQVLIISATRLLVLAPAADPEVVSIRVENIDQDGVLVAGESVTAAAAYTFKRPLLTTESTLVRVVKALLQDLKRQVIAEVALTIHTEYDGDPADSANQVELATLPGLVLIGPRGDHNRRYARKGRRTVSDGAGGFYKLRAPVTKDLTFDVVGISDNTEELFNLMQEASLYFSRNPYLVMDLDASNPAAGVVRYEMMLTAPFDVATRPNTSNVRQFMGTMILRGVILDDASTAAGLAVLQGKDILDLVPTGANPETETTGATLTISPYDPDS